MANRFWVGGSGTWDTTSTANWSTTTGGAAGASAPASDDAAIFDANSGSGYVITLGESVTVLSVTANASTGLTFDFQNYEISVAGGSSFVWRMFSAMSAFLGTPIVNLIGSPTSGTRTIIPGSDVTNPASFYIGAGSDTVALTVGSTGRYKNLDFTGFAGGLIWPNNTSAISIYGDLVISSAMTLPGVVNNPVSFFGTGVIQKITTAGKTFNFPMVLNGISSEFEFQDALTQEATRAFTVTNGTVSLNNGVTSTVGAFATSGTNQKFLESTLAGTQATLSQASGTVNASNLTIKDINATGGATFNSYTTNGNVDGGNNSGWDFNLLQLGQYIFTRRKNKRLLP